MNGKYVNSRKVDELPLVTVYTLAYNTGKYVIEAIKSVIDQTYPLERIKHIIIDDCSQDNSAELLENWIRENNYPCEFIKHEENWGICRSLNQALSKVEGKYCTGISDDIFTPNYIETFVYTLENSPENVGISFSNMKLINSEGEVYGDTYFDEDRYNNVTSTKGTFFEKLVKDYFLPGPALFYKSAAILDIAPYDESIKFDDYDFHLRFARKYDYIYVDQKLSLYRKHECNVSQAYDTKESIETMQYAVMKHFNDKAISNSERDEIARLIKRNMTKSYYYGYGWLFRMKLYLNFFFKSKYKKIAFDYIRLTIVKVTKLRYKKLIGKNG